MTYLQFHLVFLGPPLIYLLWSAAGPGRSERAPLLRHLTGTAAVALIYTVPWDATLLTHGVWSYGAGRVSASIGPLPVGELLFIVLQTALGGLVLSRLRRRRGTVNQPRSPGTGRSSGAALWLGAGLVGLLLMATPRGLYLGSLLAWASVPLALHALAGGDILRIHRRLRVAAIVVTGLYLCVADRAALALGIWRLSAGHVLGPAVGGLPIEEGVFFFVTSRLVVDSLVLLDSPLVRSRVSAVLAPFVRHVSPPKRPRLRTWRSSALILFTVGCAGTSRTSDDYRHKIANTAQSVDSTMQIALLDAELVRDDKTLAPTLRVPLEQGYSEASSTVEGFTSLLPPHPMDAATAQSIQALLNRAVSLMRQARVAAGQGAESELPSMIDELTRVSDQLKKLEQVA